MPPASDDPLGIGGRSPEQAVEMYEDAIDEDLRGYAVLAVRLLQTANDLRGIAMSDLQNGSRGSMAALRWLAEADRPLAPTELARRMHVTGARVTCILNTLEERGLVTRRRSESDRRRVEVNITEDGRAVIRTMNEGMLTGLAGFLSDLGEEDSTDLVRIMTRVAEVSRVRSGEGRGVMAHPLIDDCGESDEA